MRDLEKQVSLGEISYSRMIEILCEKADEYAKSSSLPSSDVKVSELPSKEIDEKDIRKILDRISIEASFMPEGAKISGVKEGLSAWVPEWSKELAVEQILSLLSKQGERKG